MALLLEWPVLSECRFLCLCGETGEPEPLCTASFLLRDGLQVLNLQLLSELIWDLPEYFLLHLFDLDLSGRVAEEDCDVDLCLSGSDHLFLCIFLERRSGDGVFEPALLFFLTVGELDQLGERDLDRDLSCFLFFLPTSDYCQSSSWRLKQWTQPIVFPWSPPGFLLLFLRIWCLGSLFQCLDSEIIGSKPVLLIHGRQKYISKSLTSFYVWFSSSFSSSPSQLPCAVSWE